MGSMDDNSAATLLQRPPPPQAAGEPPAAPPEGEGGAGRVRGKLSGKDLRTLAATLLVANYVKVVGRSIAEYDVETPGAPLPWRVPAGVALSYAAAAAIIWFFRLHDHVHDDRARWGGKTTKQAAHVLVYAIVFVLCFFSASMAPCALYMFLWVGSRDHVYLGLEVHKEESQEKQYGP
jgi:hypothetical protein